MNGTEIGVGNSELKLARGSNIKVTAKATAYLSEKQDEAAAAIAGRLLTEPPYWNTERARIKATRKVFVELIVNGEVKARSEINADGNWSDLNFNYQLQQSAWIALRIFPAAHTNPVFVIVDNKPIHVKKSAEWCRQAVDQCWKTKEANIRKGEKQAAEAAYKMAATIYDGILKTANQ